MISFADFEARKTNQAADATIRPLQTMAAGSLDARLPGIGNGWSRRLYDGEFRLFEPPEDRPSLSLVFVQSRDGNTGARNPAELGGGPTDAHLIYEGLSRVASDAVLAGAATAAGRQVFFSVWHPELVSLRQTLGLPRHPAQIVLSQDGRVDVDRTLLFNVPDVPVFVLAGEQCRERCRGQLARRAWVTVVPMDTGEPDGLEAALVRLRREHGIQRISAVGGRTAATSLVDAGLVQDLCLTTAARAGGEPNTPWHVGRRQPILELVVRKRELEAAEPIVFEHWALANVVRN